LFSERARSTPEKTAVLCDGSRLTYAALDQRSTQIAARFQRAASLKNGDRIAVILPRSELLLTTILAVWKCGAVYVPVDPKYPAGRIESIIDNSRPALRISADFDFTGDISETAYMNVEPQQSDLAYIIYTSGSTGIPKGAMVEHAGMLNHI